MPGRENHQPKHTGGKADFGFRDVDEGDKAPLVRAVFESVAPRYDLMNDLMSGGLHRLWKAALVDWLMPRRGLTLIDAAGGTGDIAGRILERIGGDGVAIVCDVNPAMLEAGRGRAVGARWVCGDAEALPLPDMCADAYTIAFGLRNVTDKPRALAEARRVLKPGGRFLCLEFSHVALPLLGQAYRRYAFSVVPWLGQVVAGDRAAYQYLVESIERFPDQAELSAMIAAAGLARVKHRDLTGGVAAIHSAWRV